MEDDVKKLKTELSLFKNMVQAIYATLNINQLLNLILDLLINTVGAEVGLIILRDKKNFIARASIGLSEKILREIKAGPLNLLEWLLKRQKVTIIKNIVEDEKFVFNADSNINLHSVMALPLQTPTEPLGMIILANKAGESEKDFFTKEDSELAAGILTQVAVVIENAILYEEVSNLKNYNDSILHSLPNGIITTDLEGTIITVNKGAVYILNISAERYLGQNVALLFSKVLNSDFDILKYIRTGENILDYEISMEKENGDIVVLGVSVSVLKSIRNKIIGSAIHLTDFSARKILESQAHRADQLAALGEMSAGVAHEIKNPLTSIQGFTQLLPQKKDDPKFMEKYIEIVTRETNRLNNIVERFLAFARPRTVGFQSCNVNDIVTNALSLLHYQIEKNGIQLSRKLLTVPPVRGDWQQLEQVFINIVLNAVQMMDKPEKSLEISTGSVLRKMLDNRYKEYVVIRIADNGPGISPGHINKIFNPFFTTRQDGTGLGLSITNQIVEKHSGSIEVTSRPGQGTAFSVALPVFDVREGGAS